MAGRSYVGLDIGSTLIKVAEVRRSGVGIEVSAAGVTPTPPEAFENSVIVDAQLLGQAVKKLLKDNGISSRQSISSVSGQSAVVVRVIEVPQMSSAELAETMKWEVERHVPFAVNEVIMDYQPIERPEGYADGQNMEVLLAVAQQDMIDRHVEMLFAAGLKPVAIDVEPLAVGRTLLELGHDGAAQPGHTVAIVNIGASNTDIGIFRDKLPAFFRTLPLAGDNFTRAIADALQVDVQIAEQYKKDSGEVLVDQIPQLGGAAPEWTPSSPGAGFVDFTAPPAGTAAQPDTEEPSTPSGRMQGSTPSGRMHSTGSASGRMPFDFSTPGEAPPPVGSTPPSSGAPAPAAPIAQDLNAQPAPEPAPESTPPVPDLVEPEAPPAAADTQKAEPAEPAAPAAPAANLPAAPKSGDPVLEARRILVFNAMAPVLTELAQELRRSLDYYKQRSTDAEIHEMLVVGGTSRLRNLAQYLEGELGLPVRVVDPLHTLPIMAKSLTPTQLQEVAPMFPISIGLGARDLIATPAATKARR